MSIETERCLLRPVTKEDRHDVHQLYASKDVRRVTGEAVDGFAFQKRFDGMLRNPGQNWVIRLKETGDFVGIVSIDAHAGGEDQEISYRIQKQFWSTGLAGEALAAVMDYAAQTLQLASLVAETQDANEPSKNLLKKLGMRFDGTAMRSGEKQAIFRKTFAA